jgi:hypothetical protein
MEVGTSILLEICAVHESLFGPKPTSNGCPQMSAFGGKVDIGFMFSFCGKSELKIGGDNFKNMPWASMGPNEKVGQDKYLKLHFYLRPPLGTYAKLPF